MTEWQTYAAIFAVGAASYAMRSVGFLVATSLPKTGLLPRILSLAPGNLFIAYAATGIVHGGWPTLAGCVGAIVTMTLTKREWAALGGGFAAAALASALLAARA
ncbi:MAG TPA: AzlD domain-containing protein [Steroidobacteraceae bacterium]|nr:AzlD domain-containing protein [Steroidobacteraceae bacterium]